MASQQTSSSNDIVRKVSKGVGWNYLSFALSKTVGLVTVSILAHLLTPASFGVVALATLAIEYLSIFNDFGLATALIQRSDDVEDASNVVFTLNLIISISLTILTILLSPLAASFFREPELTPILRWLGFSFTLNALGSVHKARLQREMQFGKKLIPEIGNNIVKGLISIGLASAGYGAWSLVYGQLSGLAISNILLWIVVPWMPRLTLIAKTAGQLFNYGISIMADKALTIFGDSFDYFLIGRLFTSTTLGIYTLAYKLPELLVITTLNVLGGVFFPAFSTIQHQPEELKKSFLAATKYVQLLVTPICLGLIVAADPIIRVVFGLQWLEAIPLMQILSVYTLVLSIGYHVGDVYKAIGRPDILIKLSIPILVIRIIALWIGSHHGLIGVAVGHLAATCLEVIIRTIVTIRVIKISLLDFTRQLSAFIGGGVLLALTIPTFYATSTLQPTIQLISIGFIGAIGYTIAIWFIEKDSLIKIFQLLGLVPKKLPHPVQG